MRMELIWMGTKKSWECEYRKTSQRVFMQVYVQTLKTAVYRTLS